MPREDATQWDRYCRLFRLYPELGFSLDVSRMRFSEKDLKRLEPQIIKALEDMKSLEAGDTANPDENRMVGHYWLRAPDLAPTDQIRQAITSSLASVKSFAEKVHSGKVKPERKPRFENMLLIGIGGSALGPQLVSDALGRRNQSLKPYCLDNTDPDGIARTLEEIGPKLDSTLVIVVSKSGKTPETRNGMLEVAKAYEESKLRFGAHAVAVTSAGSQLDRTARGESWLKAFEMWDWIGGRTSVFSAVGLLPSALQGIDVDGLLEGAKLMDARTRSTEWGENPAALLAAMWHIAGNGRGDKNMVVIPYKDRLALFSKYLQQLVMESLGKERDLAGNIVHQGITVYGNKGSTDQHAYVQQLRDGRSDFFVTFIEVLADCSSQRFWAPCEIEPDVTSGDFLSGFLLGTREALYQNERGSLCITVDTLDARSLGALIALYERAVGLYASLIGINAYHQPGVEAGKKAAGRVIEIQQALFGVLRRRGLSGAPQSVAELAREIGASDEQETVYKVLEHLVANKRGIAREGSRKPAEAVYRLVIS